MTNIVSDDGRPQEQYSAIQVHLGHAPAGWLTTEDVTSDQVSRLVDETPDLYWDEHGQIAVTSAR